MQTSNSQSGTTSPNTQITVKAKKSLADYFDMLYTARNYYDAMRLGAEIPKKKLPPLSDMLDAYTICMAYAEAKSLPPPNLVKALTRLDTEKIVAIWLLHQHPNCNMTIGDKQIVVLNTSKA